MAAAKYNLRVEEGATFMRTFTIDDENEDPIDYEDWGGRMHIRRRLRDAQPMLVLTTENGGISITLNEVTVIITAEQTAELESDGIYDLELYNNSGLVERLVQGKVFLDKEVTRE